MEIKTSNPVIIQSKQLNTNLLLSGIDGDEAYANDVVKYDAPMAIMGGKDYFDEDNFYPADGEYSEIRGRRKRRSHKNADGSFKNDFDTTMPDSSGYPPSEVGTIGRSSNMRGKRYRKGGFRHFLDKMQKNRAQKLKNKRIEAKSQLETAKAMQNKSGDIAMSKALRSMANSDRDAAIAESKVKQPTDKKGMSMGVKIAIGAGAALLLGTVLFLALRKPKAVAAVK